MKTPLENQIDQLIKLTKETNKRLKEIEKILKRVDNQLSDKLEEEDE